MVTLAPFPAPPGPVLRQLEVLAAAATGSEQQRAALEDLAGLALPWDPGTCDEALLGHLWPWCDQVAAWVNHTYAWRPQHMIPACWARHPHLAAELPGLAVSRWRARGTLAPALLEDWHRYTLPGFLERMRDRLGDSSCRTNGTHQAWPAAARFAGQQRAPHLLPGPGHP